MIPTTSGITDLVVAYRQGKGPDAWRLRALAEGGLPGAWPYGLEQLNATGRTVTAVEVPELSGLQRRIAATVGIRRSRRPATTRLGLAWNETTALPMLAALHAQRMFAGVIWATDAVAAGDHSTLVRSLSRSLPRLDGLWTLSRPQVEAVKLWLGRSCPPVKFLPFGVDTEFYGERPFPDQPHVVSVGGDRDRDPVTLFEAMSLVRERRPDVRVSVQTSSSEPPPDGVDVVPHLRHHEVRDLLASASVVAIATRPNLHASGITVGLEAMSTGRPVVASATPGMDDYFADGQSSRLVAPGSAHAMAEAVLDLLADRDAAAAMGKVGRKSVETRHSVATMCQHLAEITGA
jgi:glycosyltransferase involved in cell wall biosynthesis